MDMCVRVRRGLVLAGLLLGVGFVGLPAGAAYAAPPAEAGASVNSIVVHTETLQKTRVAVVERSGISMEFWS